MLQLMCEGCSYTYPPLHIVRYSFIQLGELEQCRVKNLPNVLTPQHRIRTRVLVVKSPWLYPWATALIYSQFTPTTFHHRYEGASDTCNWQNQCPLTHPTTVVTGTITGYNNKPQLFVYDCRFNSYTLVWLQQTCACILVPWILQ